MTESSKILVAEFDRVVNCPYPTQLKGLRDILYTKCTEDDIGKCVRERLCQLDRLAEILLDGLLQWPYVLEIVSRLSYHIPVRDALLRLQPNLLSSILEEAVKTENVHSRYTAAAVAMLSHSLPPDSMLPAPAQQLFIRLVDHAAWRPLASTIKPVLAILRGTSDLLLGLLSTDSLSRFEEQLFGILRSSTMRPDDEPNDHYLTLYCLAVMKAVTEARDEQLRLANSSFDTQDLLASTQAVSPRWDAEGMRKFLAKPKTLQLLVLRVMDAVRINNDGHLSTLLEIVGLAHETLSTIPADLKARWCTSNAIVVQRLQHKALATELDTRLRLQAFAFLSQLSEIDQLLGSTLDAGRQLSVQPRALIQASSVQEGNAVVHFVAAASDPSTVATFLPNIVDFLCQARAGEVIKGSSVFVAILQQMSATVIDDQLLAEAATKVLTSSSMAQKLEVLAEMDKSKIDKSSTIDTEVTICRTTLLNARRRIVHALCAFLLKSALTAHDLAWSISTGIIPTLLNLHALSAQLLRACPHSKSQHRNATPFAFVEVAQTPQEQPGNWREALAANFDTKSKVEYDKITKIFAQACADLETRCETTEQPLRAEQEKRSALQSEYDQLNTAYAELEMHGIDSDLRLEALEAEKGHVMEDLDAVQERATSLSDRVSELKQMLADAHAKSDHNTAESRNSLQMLKVERDSTLANKQEELEVAQDSSRESARQLEEKEAEIQSLKVDIHRLRRSYAELTQARDCLNNDLSKSKTLRISMEHEIQTTQAHNADLGSSLISAREEMRKQKEAHESHILQLKEHNDRNREDANASHNNSMERLAIQHGGEIAQAERQLSELRTEAQNAAEHHALEVAKRDDQLVEMEQRIERMHRVCRQKDQHIAEANAMRVHMMAAMGLGGIQLSLPHRSRPSSLSQRRQTQAQRDPDDATPPTPVLSTAAAKEEAHHAQEDASFASSTSSHERSGSTPKRPRPRNSFRAPLSSKSRYISKAGSRVGGNPDYRQPLLNLSVNKAEGRMAKTTVVKTAGFDDDDETFDGSEIFADTAGQAFQADLDRMMCGNVDGSGL